MTIQRVVVGVDGSDGAQRALAWCADLSLALDAEAVAVHVVPRSWLFELAALQIDTRTLVGQIRANLVDTWTETLHQSGVRYSTEFVRGDPATELLRVAETRQGHPIVIGGTHRGELRDALLGDRTSGSEPLRAASAGSTDGQASRRDRLASHSWVARGRTTPKPRGEESSRRPGTKAAGQRGAL